MSILNREEHDPLELTTALKGVDEAHAVPSPAGIGKLHVVAEHEAACREQVAVHAERGVLDALPDTVKAAETHHVAEAARTRSESEAAQLAHDQSRLEKARALLSPHVRRPDGWKKLYYARLALILGGDIAGIAGGAMWIGEEPVNAFLLGGAAAVAAITLGGVGREVRYAYAARTRRGALEDNLVDAAVSEPYLARLLPGAAGERVLRALLLTCLVGTLLLALGIFALRTSTHSTAAGITFTLVAVALGLASFYNSFDVADEVAELLDVLDRTAAKTFKRATKAAKSPEIARHAAAAATAQAKLEASARAGEAAVAAVERHLYAVLGDNPGVAGHGTAAGKVASAPERITLRDLPEQHLNGQAVL